MTKVFIVLFSCLSQFCFCQSSIEIQVDSTQNSYAILKVNWNSKMMYILYEDGTEKEFKVGEFLAPFSTKKELEILMSKLSSLKKEGYLLVDSFDHRQFKCFVLSKKK